VDSQRYVRSALTARRPIPVLAFPLSPGKFLGVLRFHPFSRETVQDSKFNLADPLFPDDGKLTPQLSNNLLGRLYRPEVGRSEHSIESVLLGEELTRRSCLPMAFFRQRRVNIPEAGPKRVRVFQPGLVFRYVPLGFSMTHDGKT